MILNPFDLLGPNASSDGEVTPLGNVSGSWAYTGTANPFPAAPALYDDDVDFTGFAEGYYEYTYTTVLNGKTDAKKVGISLNNYAALANDLCAGAIAMAFPTASGSRTELLLQNNGGSCPGVGVATDSGEAIPGAWGAGPFAGDIWVKFNVPAGVAAADITFTVFSGAYGSEGATDIYLALYDGSCGALSLLDTGIPPFPASGITTNPNYAVTNAGPGVKTHAELIEPEHIYYINGSRFTSVSHNLQRFYTPFDKSIAKWCARKEGVSTKEILRRWEEKSETAKEKGSNVHDFGEMYGRKLVSEKEADHPQKKAIVEWYKNMPPRYEAIAFEQILYWKEEKIAGTTDLILRCKRTNYLIPVDWKTNEADMFRVFNGRKLLYPFENIEQSEFTKYEIQLSYYKAMLKLAGFDVGPCILVWLTPKDGKGYQSFLTRDFSNKLIKYYHDIRRGSIKDTIGIL